ncbi:MAG: class I tRNA ligase family protein, partial [Anaerolineae bacterium]|nr:class I tRNA ligase family protein [Anaerolineae bacterium]
WVPEHIKDGRFGMWLENNRDWALGRERYWGTPLPVWKCDNPDCSEAVCVGSVEELSQHAGRDLSDLDLHRPYVDDIWFPCQTCGDGVMRRVPELIDVWFDSGAMPVAQWGYPFQNREMFESQFPADYICEAIDQTRGWFYSLHAIATLLFESVSFKNVICLGHILDGNGKKMSKSKGNVVNPWDVMNTQGADAARWYMYTSAPPGDSRRFSRDLVNEVISGFYLTLWNTYSFFVTYANIDFPDVRAALEPPVPVEKRDKLDRWILAALNDLVQRVTTAYETYDVPGATRPIQEFVDDLSNWYLRRTRRRFWQSEMDDSKRAAYQTLYTALTTVARLLAPAMPFLSESMYRNLVVPVDAGAAESVHLSWWPQADESLIDRALMDEMALIKRLVSLGHAARNSANLKVRQPLSEAAFAVRTPQEASALRSLAATVGEELNVKAVRVLDEDTAGTMIRYNLNPLPQKLGKRLGSLFPKVQKMLREGDPADVTAWARQLLAGTNIQVAANGQTVELTPDEVEVLRNAAEGYTVAEENGYVAALRVALTDDLVLEGLAREVVRRANTMRRDADYALNDAIHIRYRASDKLAQAIARHAEYVQGETLAVTLEADENPSGERGDSFEFDGQTLTLAIRRA